MPVILNNSQYESIKAERSKLQKYVLSLEKTAHWAPELPLPRFADRKTLARIITHHYFPVSHRTIQTWPLTVRRPNRAAVYDVAEAMEFAEQKLADATCYKQGGHW